MLYNAPRFLLSVILKQVQESNPFGSPVEISLMSYLMKASMTLRRFHCFNLPGDVLLVCQIQLYCLLGDRFVISKRSIQIPEDHLLLLQPTTLHWNSLSRTIKTFKMPINHFLVMIFVLTAFGSCSKSGSEGPPPPTVPKQLTIKRWAVGTIANQEKYSDVPTNPSIRFEFSTAV